MTKTRLTSPLQPPPRPRIIPPRDRITLWWALLAAFSIQDLLYTLVALHGIPGARELNPLPALAFEAGLAAVIALKGISLLLVLYACWALARTRHWPAAERTLAVWCALYLAINAYSVVNLLGVE